MSDDSAKPPAQENNNDTAKTPRQRRYRPKKPKSPTNSNSPEAGALESSDSNNTTSEGNPETDATGSSNKKGSRKKSNKTESQKNDESGPANGDVSSSNKTDAEQNTNTEPPSISQLNLDESSSQEPGGSSEGKPKNKKNKRNRFTKKRTQRRIEIDELNASDKLKVFQIEPELFQLLSTPSDPDFPFPIPVLSFDLHVHRHYPNQGPPPWIIINNEEIPKGNSANIENGFKEFEGTSMERIDKLDQNLEASLTKPAAKVITIVKGKRGNTGTASTTSAPNNVNAKAPVKSVDGESSNKTSQDNVNADKSDGVSAESDDEASDSGPDEPDFGKNAWGERSGSDNDDDESDEYAHSSDDEDIDSGAGAQGTSSDDTGRPKREGTELVFSNIELVNISLLEISSLNIVFQCGRCKASHTFTNLQSAEYGKPTKPRAELCGKCDSPLMVAFRKEYVHSMCHTAGYLDVEGGKAVDLLPSTYQGMCQSCSNYAPPFKNMDSGAQRMVICRHCHTKLWLKVEAFDFVLLSTETLASAAKKAEKSKLGPAAPKQKSNLTGGEPLPNHGTCQHYRKSTRWFRFSCCQRVFACDQCHDLEMHHPCEFATRMICGYCSREQRFSSKCFYCEHDYTQKVSRFWEGGKGVRDRTLMSRKDKHKYKRDPAEKTKKKVHFQGKSKAVKHS